MERDFIGLGSKHAPITIKEEAVDVPTDSVVLLRGSRMQLSFSNKVSTNPQFLSFNAAQDDRTRKVAHDPPPSYGFMHKPTADSYGLSQKTYDAHRSREARIFPISNQPNQTITVSMSTPLLQPHLASNGQNIIGHTTVSPQPFAGVPIMAPPVSVVPPSSSVIGTTNLRNAPKSSGAPSQLTIFYAGSVCVYDVSPEKAQAIMLLAGNGSSTSQTKPAPMTLAQTHISQPCTAGASFGNSSCTMSPFSSLTGHLSVTSHVSLQPGGGSSHANEPTPATRLGALACSSNQPEPTKLIKSVGSSATTLVPAAVPQARKASLVRFLEKRKERVSSTSPYSVCKKSSDSSDGLSFSVTSAGSSHLQAIN